LSTGIIISLRAEAAGATGRGCGVMTACSAAAAAAAAADEEG